MCNRVLAALIVSVCLGWGTTTEAAAQVISQAPASPSWEMVPPRPGPAYAWIGGHWMWNGTRYAWITGHYALPPYTGAHWLNGYWRRVADGWEYVDGRWTSPSAPKTRERV